MTNNKKNIFKAILSGVLIAIILLFTIVSCNRNQAKAETIDLTPVNTYDNGDALMATKWLITSENINIIQCYATSSSVYTSFNISYAPHYDWDWVTYSITLAKYTNTKPYYQYGCCYYPTALYMQTAIETFTYISMMSATAPKWFILDFSNLNITTSNAQYVYLPRYQTLRAMATELTGMSDNQVMLMLGSESGRVKGIDEVKQDPNKYGLHNEQQYLDYGQAQYNEGLRIGSDGVAKSQTWFLGIFNALSQVFGIKIFGGSVTLGMICLIPFSIEFVFVIFKLIRGGD